MLAGDERKRLVEVGAKFIGRAGFAWIVSGHRNAAAESFAGVFKTADIITLPAVEGNRDGGELGHGRIGIDAEVGILGLGEFVGLGDGF